MSLGMEVTGTSIDCDSLTETEREVLGVLLDGGRQTPTAIIARLSDPLMSRSTLSMHVSNIRAKLEPSGIQVLHRMQGKRFEYVLARTLYP